MIVDTTVKISALRAQIDKYRYNPSGIQRAVLQHLNDVSSGAIDVVDPTNPFVFALESSAVNTASFISQAEALTRKQYPAASQTPEDLYVHMSDKDFIDRFASPSKCVFTFMMSKTEFLGKMVLDPATGISKITIPRNTEFTVMDTVFSLQYPIDIKQLVHGGLQVVYDATLVSPLQELETNVIIPEIRTSSDGLEWIYFTFDVYQFNILSSTIAITAATTTTKTITLTDQYYYCRAFYRTTESAAWIEVRTTHTDQVYDITVPTVVLKVVGDQVTITVPVIYSSNDVMKGTLRVDVYQTKGDLTMIMEDYQTSSFSTNYRYIDVADATVYAAVPPKMSTIFSFSRDVASGGTPALTFDELKTKVIENGIGEHKLPITNTQITSSLEKKNYSIVKNVDLVTNRVFLATRPLPAPTNEKLITAAASNVGSIIDTMNNLSSYEGVKTNDQRITLTPDLLYKNTNGVISIVPKTEVDAILALAPDKRAIQVNNNNYLYTPFHYVLDASDTEFSVRPYYLDAPEAQTVTFVSQNDLTGLQVNTSSYQLIRTTTGYKLHVSVTSNDAYKALGDNQVYVQLSYIPEGELDRAVMNGVLVGTDTDTKERIFEFDLSSNMDIDSSDFIGLQKFLMFTLDARVTKSTLLNTFDIVHATSATMDATWSADAGDTFLGQLLLPSGVVAITHEKARLLFGKSLNTLWARARSIVSASNYLTYETDIPWTYEKDVYATDPVTGTNFTVQTNPDGSTELVYTKLHSVGDNILDAGGGQTYRYLAGEVKLDSYGKPIPIDVAKVSRQVDIFFIEGSYYFATDVAATTYRSNIVSAVVSWLTTDLADLTKVLLEQSRLYFYAKTTMGSIKALVGASSTATIEASQSLTVTLYVSDAVYRNADLRASLSKSTITTIDAKLKNAVISTSDITTALKAVYGDDVKNVELKGFGGADNNYPAMTVMTDGARCSLRKNLVALADGKLITQEAVDISYVRHDSSTT